MAKIQPADLGYYRRVKREDPTFTAGDAVMEYLDEHPDEAADIAAQFWENNPDDEMFSSDTMWDIVDAETPEEAFRLGCMADEGITGADWVRFDGYGNLRIVSNPKEYRKDACRDGMRHILDGDYEISDDLRAIIDLFRPSGSGNRRPAKKTASKAAPRKTPSRCVGASKKAPGRKVQSKCAGTSKKAPAKRTAAKAKRPATDRR